MEQLYNLRDDLGEQNDLIAVETEIAARLSRMLLEWVETSPAIVPERNPVPAPYPDLAGAFLHAHPVDPMMIPGGIPPEDRVN